MVIDESGGQRTMSYQDKRATLLKEHFSKIDLYIANNCKHLVQWDVTAPSARHEVLVELGERLA